QEGGPSVHPPSPDRGGLPPSGERKARLVRVQRRSAAPAGKSPRDPGGASRTLPLPPRPGPANLGKSRPHLRTEVEVRSGSPLNRRRQPPTQERCAKRSRRSGPEESERGDAFWVRSRPKRLSGAARHPDRKASS